MFLEALRKSEISLRPGTSKLLSFCRKSQIPTIVTSAGFANVIYTTMESHGVATSINDHFYVDANFLEFSDDNDGVLERITPERPVHSEAKKYMPLRLGHLLPLKPRLSAPEDNNRNRIMKSQISSTAALEPPLHLHYLHGLPLSMQLSALDGGAAATKASEGIAAIVLGDRPADFEVLSEVAGASMFRIGFALTDEKADELLSRDCCDVVLIGPEHGVDPVLHTLQKLSEIRDFHLRQSSRDVSLVPYRPRPKSQSLVEVKVKAPILKTPLVD